MHHRLDQNFVNDGIWNARLNVEWEKWQKLSPEVQTEQMLEAMQAEIGWAKRESERWNSVFGGVWGAKNRQRVWEERLRRAKEANTFSSWRICSPSTLATMMRRGRGMLTS